MDSTNVSLECIEPNQQRRGLTLTPIYQPSRQFHVSWLPIT